MKNATMKITGAVGIILLFVGANLVPLLGADTDESNEPEITYNHEMKANVIQNLGTDFNTVGDPRVLNIVTDEDKNDGSENSITTQYCFQKPITKKITLFDQVFDSVEIEGLSSNGDSGEPMLPMKDVTLLLPPNTQVDTISVSPGIKTTIPGHYNVACGQEPVPISSTGPIEITSPDPHIYEFNAPYPGVFYKKIGVQTFFGYSLLTLILYPVQYNPVQGKLSFYSSMEVTVTVTPHTALSSLYRGLEKDKEKVIKIIDNPSFIEHYDSLGEGSRFMRQDPLYDLVIITTEELRNGFELLQEVHNYQGLSTTIVTVEDIMNNQSYWNSTPLFNDTPAQIRNFIRYAYSEWGIEYVLLGGDHPLVPARFLFFGWEDGEEYHGPSDFYYSCLDGSYNSDNDSYWGELDDGFDINPDGEVDLSYEVAVGRACVDTIEEVSNFVSKTVSYLTLDPSDEYLHNTLMAGEYLWGPPEHELTFASAYMEELINGSSANGYQTIGMPYDDYNFSKLYDEEWPGFTLNDPFNTGWPRTEIITAINRNTHIINHLGHSSYDYNMKLSNPDVDYLLTNTKYCFIYSQGCMAGGFDNPYGFDCIAEHFTVTTNHGAFAVIMNARYGWGHAGGTNGPNQHYHRQFWDAVFGEGFSTLGVANQDSKLDNIAYINNGRMRWCCYEINLLGDPSLDFFGQISNNPPEKPEAPQGVDEGRPTLEYTFSANTSDPEGDNVYYMWDWGDNTQSTWLGPYLSEEVCSVSHNWTDIGVYQVRVKARDQFYKVSEWSDLLSVDIHIETIFVDDDAPLEWYDALHVRTIQEGISNITYPGDIVYVYNGTYNEHVIIAEMLSIVGECTNSVVIDGSGVGDVVSIAAENVVLSRFTIQHGERGVVLGTSADSATITDSCIRDNGIGVCIDESSNNILSGNNIIGNTQYGVFIQNTPEHPSDENRVCHNNFIDNVQHAYDQGTTNRWDDGYPSCGNYWDDYIGVDTNYGPAQDLPGSDGVSDTSYILDEYNHEDHYPLMNPWSGISPVPPLTIVYVDDNFTPSTPGWGYQYFDRVQDAVDIISEGGTVFVYEGLYNEHVEINTPLHLIGQDKLTTTINGNGATYALRVNADAVNISDITIQNSGGTIGLLISSDYNTINNVIVTDSNLCMYTFGSYNHITNNTIETVTGDRGGGILLFDDSSCNEIINNSIVNDGAQAHVGIWLCFSMTTFKSPKNNIIIGNTISHNYNFGMAIVGSQSNTVSQNNIMDLNGYGFILQSYFTFYSEHNNVTENLIQNNAYDAILLFDQNNNNFFAHNTITLSGCGVVFTYYYLTVCTKNVFRENTITVSGNGPYYPNYGFFFDYDDERQLDNDIDSTNTVNGKPVFVLANRHTPTVIEDLDMEFSGTTYVTNFGILNLYNCSSITIRNCTIGNNSNYGLYLTNSSDNTISENTFTRNNYGINLDEFAQHNLISHNNFISNTHHALNNGLNTWNESYPSGGNYWSGFIVQDMNHGPLQNLPGGDGIGDSSYPIPTNNYDYYPFTNRDGWIMNYPPYSPYDPQPSNGERDVPTHDVILSWMSGDPDTEDTVTYDVYFGDTSPPPQVIWNQTENTYDPGALNYLTDYYWKIVVWDSYASPHHSIGPTWEFSTGDDIPPEWRNQGQNKTLVEPGKSISLFAQARDNVGLKWAWLATNETGIWQNFSGDGWWDGAWEYSRQIKISHPIVADDLENFPVLIQTTVDPSKVQNDGDDIIFVSSDNLTQYNHEIESYNGTTGELIAWVNIPFLSSTQDTILYMYYRNPLCDNQERVGDTWSNGFIAVYHMEGASYTELDDSTINHWDITSMGGNPVFNQPGKIGRCVDFDGNGDYLKASLFRLLSDGSHTASAWAYVDGNSGTRKYVFEGDADAAISLLVWTNDTAKARTHTSGGWPVSYSSTDVMTTPPQWFYLTTQVDTEEDILAVWVNGVREDTTPFTGLVNPETEGLNIGTSSTNNNYWMNGKLDEIRISNVVRSPAWVHTEYTMMSSSFITVSPEQESIAGEFYGSPMTLHTGPDEWTWSNFTWQNASIPVGTTVGWRIYYMDSNGNIGHTDIMSFTIGTSNAPPNTPIKPVGPTTGFPLFRYRYGTTTVDPDGDQVYYLWDWGDGNTSGWRGPYPSGWRVTAYHGWAHAGVYFVKVKAKDVHEAESAWSLPLRVRIRGPFSPSITLEE